jgi:hypothetical protein
MKSAWFNVALGLAAASVALAELALAAEVTEDMELLIILF